MSEETEKRNPLSAYGVSNKEFRYFEKFYVIEQKAFLKGLLAGLCIEGLIWLLVAVMP